jgi:hypothetical protein
MPPAATDWNRDILMTSLMIDLEAMAGHADIVVSGSLTSTGASFEIGDLVITDVTANGVQLNYMAVQNRLDVGLPPSADAQTITIEYSFNVHDGFNGLLDNGTTVTWPYYCGNVFPCKSDPAEGSVFELAVSGVPENAVSVYPETVAMDVPAYMLAWATGEYNYTKLGETANGTEVGVYYFTDLTQQALLGTRYLRDVFDWYERTLGEYRLGDKVASVSVDWGGAGFGGLEHHPYWHVSTASMSDPVVHAHEASHGWFGNAVRIKCWEDFVLSEGMASYLAARALNDVAGTDFGDQIWASYESRLINLQNSNNNKIAWPQGCNETDILDDGLFGEAPYMKGAFFFKHLEYTLGVALIDRLLGEFYIANRGDAVTMQAFLDMVRQNSGYDPTGCALAWLRTEFLPEGGRCAL